MSFLKRSVTTRLAIAFLFAGIPFVAEAVDTSGITADLYLSQLAQDMQTIVDNSQSLNFSHISPDVLAEYNEFCLSNIYLDEPASRQALKIIKYLKSTPEAKSDYAITRIKQVTTDHYRAMACMISFASAVNENEKVGEGKKFRDRINVAGEKNDYAAIKSIYQEWLAYISKYQNVQLSGNSEFIVMTRKAISRGILGMKSDIAQIDQIISKHQASANRQINNGTVVKFECIAAASCYASYASMSGGTANIPTGIGTNMVSLFDVGRGIAGNYNYQVKISKSGESTCTGSIDILERDTYVVVSLYPDCSVSNIYPRR